MTSGEHWKLGHRPALDGLRGVAVLLVVAGHAIPGRYSLAGAVGVSVFFALSGFLITTLLLEHRDDSGRLGLGGFYLRRARRLLPAVVVFLVCMAGIGFFAGPWLATAAEAVPPLFYVQNFAVMNQHPAGALLHLWSLSVEEQFYLIWPGMLGIALLWRRRAAVVVAIALVASLGVRLWLFADGASLFRIYFASDTNACLLLAGCAASLAVRHTRPRVPRLVFWLMVAAIVELGFLPNTRMTLALVPMVAVALAVPAIFAAVSDKAPTTSAGLNLMGRRSYALYLWHYPLVAVVPMHLPVSLWLSVPAGVVLAWCMTLLSWRYVERPFLQRYQADSTFITAGPAIPPACVVPVPVPVRD